MSVAASLSGHEINGVEGEIEVVVKMTMPRGAEELALVELQTGIAFFRHGEIEERRPKGWSSEDHARGKSRLRQGLVHELTFG